MGHSAIAAHGVSKRYRIGELRPGYRTLRETLSDSARHPLRALRGLASGAIRYSDQDSAAVMALSDVSFTAQVGEKLGIIGGNGAGKSTLLKILSRITEPTAGLVDLRGRVGSLLEVGTGFHPELTGRENIFLNGAILGMRKADIARRFDAIVEFSEISRFIDTPVKHFSSGMYVRLAFAVAAHLEPEILLVDEVLAVGDASFQKKCLGKMSDVGSDGRTVLFVSHNMVAVQTLCDRAIWLDGGRVVADGAAVQVVSEYLRRSVATVSTREWLDQAEAPGNDLIRLHAARVRAEGGAQDGLITIRTPITVEIEYWNLDAGAKLNLSVVLWNEEGTAVFNSTSQREREWHGREFPRGLFRSRFTIPGDLLNSGAHRIELYVVRDETVVIYRRDDLVGFEVAEAPEMRGAWHGRWVGAVRPDLEWTTEKVGA